MKRKRSKILAPCLGEFHDGQSSSVHEWFNPASGETISHNSIPAGSSSRSFNAPFTGDAVLYLVDSVGHH